MPKLQGIIFDLGGTLLDWHDWDNDSPRRWGLSYDYLAQTLSTIQWPERSAYVQAMRDAELAHWQQVVSLQTSNTPVELLRDGFQRLNHVITADGLLAALDGYARAVDGWAFVFPDAVQTLQTLRAQGYRLGLLSNTWWAADWHNADLAAHGLAPLLDVVVYTSDLPHSKPHPSTFLEVASRLHVEPEHCVMIGDRLIDDVRGALGVGMRAIWKENTSPWPRPADVIPTAVIRDLAELPALFAAWAQA
ncbi:MAG TPA: HAD family hydrolase [Ktedonobacteraceae bacterium]|nr:HAD family hydrolase [Ktedonobacteraceae bacterium]